MPTPFSSAPPPHSVPTERENALNALVIDRAADLPVMLYNYPGPMDVSTGEEFLDRVGRSRNFQAIKESSGDINRLHLLARDYPHIQLSCGMNDQALGFFSRGDGAGSAADRTSCRRNTSRSGGPALSRAISPRAGGLCRQ